MIRTVKFNGREDDDSECDDSEDEEETSGFTPALDVIDRKKKGATKKQLVAENKKIKNPSAVVETDINTGDDTKTVDRLFDTMHDIYPHYSAYRNGGGEEKKEEKNAEGISALSGQAVLLKVLKTIPTMSPPAKTDDPTYVTIRVSLSQVQLTKLGDLAKSSAEMLQPEVVKIDPHMVRSALSKAFHRDFTRCKKVQLLVHHIMVKGLVNGLGGPINVALATRITKPVNLHARERKSRSEKNQDKKERKASKRGKKLSNDDDDDITKYIETTPVDKGSSSTPTVVESEVLRAYKGLYNSSVYRFDHTLDSNPFWQMNKRGYTDDNSVMTLWFGGFNELFIPDVRRPSNVEVFRGNIEHFGSILHPGVETEDTAFHNNHLTRDAVNLSRYLQYDIDKELMAWCKAHPDMKWKAPAEKGAYESVIDLIIGRNLVLLLPPDVAKVGTIEPTESYPIDFKTLYNVVNDIQNSVRREANVCDLLNSSVHFYAHPRKQPFVSGQPLYVHVEFKIQCNLLPMS